MVTMATISCPFGHATNNTLIIFSSNVDDQNIYYLSIMYLNICLILIPYHKEIDVKSLNENESKTESSFETMKL